ncbi:PucR family transcriptional regulator [Tsukamurella serpentis]
MPLTVRNLARRQSLGLRLVAGAQAADREILWAHPIELEDPSPWLSPGVLVMTTGPNLGSTAAQQRRYVERLVRAGAAGLAVDTGTVVDRVPEGIAAAGTELGLPILAVPARTPFIAVTHEVVDEITRSQVRQVQSVVDQQDRLARALLRDGLPGLVAALGKAVSAPLAVVDGDGSVLATAGRYPAAMIERARAAIADAFDGQSLPRNVTHVIEDATGCTTLMGAALGGGRIVMLGAATPAPLESSGRILMAHAIALATLALGRATELLDAEERLRGAITSALLAAPGTVAPDLLTTYGFDPAERVVPIVLTGVEQGSANVVLSVIRRGRIPYLSTTIDQGLVVLVPAERAGETLDAVERGTAEVLRRTVRGVRGPETGWDGIGEAVHRAAAAALLADGGGISSFGEATALMLVLSGRDRADLRAIAAAALGPLDGELTDTLRAYLDADGRLERAAETLGVHRHTVRHRLARVEALLGCDLTASSSRAELWLALRAQDLADVLEPSSNAVPGAAGRTLDVQFVVERSSGVE